MGTRRGTNRDSVTPCKTLKRTHYGGSRRWRDVKAAPDGCNHRKPSHLTLSPCRPSAHILRLLLQFSCGDGEKEHNNKTAAGDECYRASRFTWNGKYIYVLCVCAYINIIYALSSRSPRTGVMLVVETADFHDVLHTHLYTCHIDYNFMSI